MRLLLCKTPSGWRLVLHLCALLLLFVALHLALVQKQAHSASAQTLVRRVETDRRRVALTFNVNWGDRIVPQILDSLDAGGVRATFFVTGPWAGVQPEILSRMHRERHEIGNFGYKYEDLSKHSAAVIKEQISRAQEIIAETTGYVPAYFRPPHGYHNETIVLAAAQSGYVTVLWDVDSLDRRKTDAKRIVSQILKNVRPGSIILLHGNDDNQTTVEALPLLLSGLRENGYEAVTLSCLLCSEAVD
jgi:polysaccharide deacetylase family sporulation protein PdaB